ncbi:MAG: DUF6114 domain-containing protein [Halobacteria archaeon]|nr:DUF6114 domain-containing protein [Halobacteria archaeon]
MGETSTLSKLNQRRIAFKNWRQKRPFWGSILLIISGIEIVAVPFLISDIIEIFPGASPLIVQLIASIFGAIIVGSGIITIIKPDVSTITGFVGIIMAILSILGAFGGLLIGTLLGIIGGSICIAWEGQDDEGDGDEEDNGE